MTLVFGKSRVQFEIWLDRLMFANNCSRAGGTLVLNPSVNNNVLKLIGSLGGEAASHLGMQVIHSHHRVLIMTVDRLIGMQPTVSLMI